MSNLTVISVCTIEPTNWKRPVYSKDWVDRLYRSVQRNINIPFEFVCFSNDITSNDYRIIPLITKAWGWWNKIEIFRPDLFDGPCLYIDIDNVICKNITNNLVNLPSDRMLMPVEPYNSILNSSVIFWNGNYKYVYDYYINNQNAVINQYQSSSEKSHTIGDQAFIRNIVSYIEPFDNYVPDNFFGWKHHIVGEKINNPSIIVFTGSEKPTNNQELVKQHWI